MTSTAPHAPDELPTSDGAPAIDTLHADDRRASVCVRGDLDLSTAAQLWSVLQGHLSAGRRFLRLDLSAVRFVDAAAVSAIVEVHHEALYRRGTLVVAGVTAPVAKVLSLTGVDGTLFVAGSRSDTELPHPVRPGSTPRAGLGSRAWPSPRR